MTGTGAGAELDGAVLACLRRLEAKADAIGTDLLEVKERVAMLEGHFATLSRQAE